jgi:hypothetical protein
VPIAPPSHCTANLVSSHYPMLMPKHTSHIFTYILASHHTHIQSQTYSTNTYVLMYMHIDPPSHPRVCSIYTVCNHLPSSHGHTLSRYRLQRLKKNEKHSIRFL